MVKQLGKELTDDEDPELAIALAESAEAHHKSQHHHQQQQQAHRAAAAAAAATPSNVSIANPLHQKDEHMSDS